MLLDEKTFVDLKPRFVDEVLARLRALAELEARTLFHEHLHKPSSHLPELSERLSCAINNATDAIADSITTRQGTHPELVRQLVVSYLPPSLFKRSGEQTFERIPATYLNRVIASSLASRIVYREGLDWLESMPAQAIATLAERYLVEESQVQALARQVRSSQLEQRERIAMLLETGGVAAALRTQAD